MKAIQIKTTGGPEVMEYVDLPTPVPGPKEALIKAHSIGVGMPEALVRTGRYAWMPPLPAILGIEMSGHVVAVGSEITQLKVGDPVFASARELPVRGGCYAEYLCADADAFYPLPAQVDMEVAAGLSNYQLAWHLLNSATRGYRYETVLVSAAAGGVGTAVVQLAKLAGKTVIGLAGTDEKCAFVQANGADHCFNYRRDSILDKLHGVTAGKGVDLVLDPIGGPNFGQNFSYLAPLGLVVNFGLLEGPPTSNYADDMYKRFGDSVGLRFFSMHVFDKDREGRRSAMRALLPMLEQGLIKPHIDSRFPLAQARQAHELLDSGKVLGKIILKP